MLDVAEWLAEFGEQERDIADDEQDFTFRRPNSTLEGAA